MSADATPRTCLIIRDQGLEMGQRHHRLYLHHLHHDLIPWHPQGAREPTESRPRTIRRCDADPLCHDSTCQCPSPIYTRHPAFQMSQSSRVDTHVDLPQISIPFGEHQTAQSLTWAVAAEPAAHLSTRILALRCLTCTGKRRRPAFTLFCYSHPIDTLLFHPCHTMQKAKVVWYGSLRIGNRAISTT